MSANPADDPRDEIPPELIEWALASFTEEEIVAGLREIRATGGLTFEELIAGLAQD